MDDDFQPGSFMMVGAEQTPRVPYNPEAIFLETAKGWVELAILYQELADISPEHDREELEALATEAINQARCNQRMAMGTDRDYEENGPVRLHNRLLDRQAYRDRQALEVHRRFVSWLR